MDFIITKEWLQKSLVQTPYGITPTRDQADILGETYPLKKGWLDRAIGRTITLESKERFEKKITAKQIKQAKQSNEPPVSDYNRGFQDGLVFAKERWLKTL